MHRGEFLCAFLLSAFAPVVRADPAPIIVDFESFSDSQPLTTEVPGLTFTNATVVTAGISLNELLFPPHSGVNAVFDNGGPITIRFDSPISSVGGFFTYCVSITLNPDLSISCGPSLFTIVGFDALNNQLAQFTSPSPSNLSSPNDFIHLDSPAGISKVTISGDSAGGDFTLDDLTYAPLPASSAVPEPSSLGVILIVVAAFYARKVIGFAGQE